MSDVKTLTLTQENFEREVLEAKQPVLVDFGADWCAPCRAMGPVVDQLAAEFEARAIVGKVDVDDQEALARRFGIGSIPSLLFFKDGEIAERVVGVVSRARLAEKLEMLAQHGDH